MENYVVFIVEGKNTNELRNNLESVLSDFLDYDVSFDLVGNEITFEKGDIKENVSSRVFDIGEILMLVFPIKVKTALEFFKENGKNLINEIIIISPLKTSVFIANKESLFNAINTLSYEVVKRYKNNFEEKKIDFDPKLLPIYINETIESYKIPVEIYKQFHIIYNKTLNVLKETQ